MHEKPETPQAPLFDVADIAAALKCSERNVWRMADSGRMPRPLAIGRLRRWRSADIQDWIAKGCPAVRSTIGGAR